MLFNAGDFLGRIVVPWDPWLGQRPPPPRTLILYGCARLAFVLGSLIESSFRRSMLIFDGDATGFVTRPISGTILAFVVLVIVFPLVRKGLRRGTTTTETTTPETVQREDSLR